MRRFQDHDQTETEFEQGSGNVFADLGLEDAGELFAPSRAAISRWDSFSALNI